MAKTQVNVGRQTVLTASREFNFEDLVSGEATPVIYLKPGTRILRGWLDITTAWDTGTTATISVGDTEADDVDRWLTATNAKAAALTDLLAPLTNSTINTAEAVTVTYTGTGTAPTAGVATLYIELVEAPRTTEFNTYRG